MLTTAEEGREFLADMHRNEVLSNEIKEVEAHMSQMQEFLREITESPHTDPSDNQYTRMYHQKREQRSRDNFQREITHMLLAKNEYLTTLQRHRQSYTPSPLNLVPARAVPAPDTTPRTPAEGLPKGIPVRPPHHAIYGQYKILNDNYPQKYIYPSPYLDHHMTPGAQHLYPSPYLDHHMTPRTPRRYPSARI
jgi:hypothetical protein